MDTVSFYALTGLAGLVAFAGFILTIIYTSEKWGREKAERDDFEKQIEANAKDAQALANKPVTDDDVHKCLRDAALRAKN